MKKSIITLSLIVISICGFSQKIGIKLSSKQDIVYVPAQAAITTNTDTIGVIKITDNGNTVSVDLIIGTKFSYLTLWQGQDYIDNENWGNSDILKRIKVLLNIQ
jgi:hypothetical protein